MSTDLDYSAFYDDNGQPVRPGVVLSDTELATYREFYPDETTGQTTTEETH